MLRKHGFLSVIRDRFTKQVLQSDIQFEVDRTRVRIYRLLETKKTWYMYSEAKPRPKRTRIIIQVEKPFLVALGAPCQPCMSAKQCPHSAKYGGPFFQLLSDYFPIVGSKGGSFQPGPCGGIDPFFGGLGVFMEVVFLFVPLAGWKGALQSWG